MQDKTVKRPDDRKGSTRKNIRFEDELVANIEKVCEQEGTSFSHWVKQACKDKLPNMD